MNALTRVLRTLLTAATAVVLSLLFSWLLAEAWPESGSPSSTGLWWLSLALLGVLHLAAGWLGGVALRTLHGSTGERLGAMILIVLYGLFQVAGDWGHPRVFWTHLALLACAAVGIHIGHAWRKPRRIPAPVGAR